MTDDSRNSFLSIASGFHHGERQVEAELAPLLFGVPEDYKVFLTSHLEDEARHTVFFDRFYREVVGLEGDGIMDILDGSWPFIQETFVGPFGLLAYLTDDLRRDPYDKHLQMKYATTYMIWIEGVLALSVMKITLNYARDYRSAAGLLHRVHRHLPGRGPARAGRHAFRARPAGRGPGLRPGPARHAAHAADDERGPVQLHLLRAAGLVRRPGYRAVRRTSCAASWPWSGCRCPRTSRACCPRSSRRWPGAEMPGLMTAAWAQACQDTINGWPDEARQASKLQDFWDWIGMVRPFVTGRLALSVRDMPAGADGDTLALDLEEGAVKAAAVLEPGRGGRGAAFVLAGSYADWQAMLDGYDVGKMVMYRKLMLEQGDTLMFFMAAFYWTELLAAIQSVPVNGG